MAGSRNGPTLFPRLRSIHRFSKQVLVNRALTDEGKWSKLFNAVMYSW